MQNYKFKHLFIVPVLLCCFVTPFAGKLQAANSTNRINPYGIYPPLVQAFMRTNPPIWTANPDKVSEKFPKAYTDLKMYDSINDYTKYDVILENPKTKVKETIQYSGYEIKKHFVLTRAVAYENYLDDAGKLQYYKALYDIEGQPFTTKEVLTSQQRRNGLKVTQDAFNIWEGALEAAKQKKAQ